VSYNDEIVRIWTDGSCNNRQEPHPIGGIGIVLKYKDHVKEISHGPYFNTTSARMEIQAVIHALKNTSPGFDYEIFIDNQYVQKTIMEWLDGWLQSGILHLKKNSDLWISFNKIRENHVKNGSTIKAIWIRGHSGVPENELADKLANKGRKSNTDYVD
jgi:ribonuclease HI